MAHLIIAVLSIVGLALVALVLLRSVKAGPESLGGLPTWSVSLLQSANRGQEAQADAGAPAKAAPATREPVAPRVPAHAAHFPQRRVAREARLLVEEVEQFLADQAR